MNYIVNYFNKKIKVLLTIFSPKLETKLAYRKSFKKKLDLKNPVTINEKLLWLKLNSYYNNETITKCIDKYRIREYLDMKKMNNLLPQLYGVYNNAKEIEWDKLPNSYVIKCNHGCGYNILVPDSKKINKNDIKIKLNKWMNEDYWKYGGEIQYKFIDKKIIIEEYLGDIETYKLYCFNGEPKIMYISSNKYENNICYKDEYIDFFDINFNHIDVTLKGHKNSINPIKKPKNFEEMIEISTKLSKEFPFVRVDLYNVKGKIYISELTFIPTNGFMHITPEEKLIEWGNWLKLDL